MERGLYAALSGALSQAAALDTVAHDIANAGTPGHRPARLQFSTVYAGVAADPVPLVVASSAGPDPRPGPVTRTGNPLDLAIEGAGFFAVEGPAGRALIRSASFAVDGQGQLVTPGGERLLDGDGGPVVLPGAGPVSVDPAGEIHQGGDRVARIALVESDGESRVAAGMLELSPFKVAEGMVDLVRVSRHYEALTRAIQTYRELDQRTTRELGTTK